MNPRKMHHDIPVGMMGIQYNDIDIADDANGGPNDLKSAFHTIYTGEPYPDLPADDISTYQACNHLHSYGADFTEAVWGLTTASDNPAHKVPRNAQAWANFVRAVKETNTALRGGNLKCLISRQLVGLHVARGWSIPEIKDYVRRLIDHILCDNLQGTVAGWYVSDDGLRAKVKNADGTESDELLYTNAKWKAVLHALQEVQREKKVNWPFYWADPMDLADPDREDDNPEYWTPSRTPDGKPNWIFNIPTKLRSWINAIPSDAHAVFMPYYYAWTAGTWDYGHNPPWRLWTKLMESLNAGFPASMYPNLKFHPILDASEKLRSETDRTRSTRVPPGHADMHKQIRVVSDLPNVEGIWFLGWNIDDGKAPQRAIAHNNWTTNHRWAEAIQNEPRGIEGIQDAIPAATKILPNFPNPFYIDPYAENRLITRIPYQLAERKKFKIEIYRPPNPDRPNECPDPDRPNEKGDLIRTIKEGYTNESPQGKFANTNRTRLGFPELMDLNGTSAHWDGRDETGIEVEPVNHNQPCHDYKAYLIVGENTDEICYGPITMTKAPPPPPKPSDRQDETVTGSFGDDDNITLTLKGPNSVTRSHVEAYTASITHDDLRATPLTFCWTYTTNIGGASVTIEKEIKATSEDPHTTTWSGRMVNGGSLGVSVTVNETPCSQTMNVTVANRPCRIEVPITTDTTSWGVADPRSHADLGDVEYSIPFTRLENFDITDVSSGPNEGLLYIRSLCLSAPFRVKINKHFTMAEDNLPAAWAAFKNANPQYGEIEAKVKASLGFDGTTSGTRYGKWKEVLDSGNPPQTRPDNLKEYLERFVRRSTTSLADCEQQIKDEIANRISAMDAHKSDWSPADIDINYDYVVGDDEEEDG